MEISDLPIFLVKINHQELTGNYHHEKSKQNRRSQLHFSFLFAQLLLITFLRKSLEQNNKNKNL